MLPWKTEAEMAVWAVQLDDGSRQSLSVVKQNRLERSATWMVRIAGGGRDCRQVTAFGC